MRLAGYAAVFGRRDRGGDIVLPGAFAESLKARAGRRLPLLWQHDGDQQIGEVESISEDERGLRVVARIDDRPGIARRAGEALKARAVGGLSFGYRVVKGDRAGALRRLEALDIVEVSLVTHPMQPLARVHAVEGDLIHSW